MSLQQDRRKTTIVFALLALTLILLVLQHTSFTRSIWLDARTFYPVGAHDDRVVGGLSTGTVRKLPDGAWILECDVVSVNGVSEFCSMFIDLRDKPNTGLHLLDYQQIRINAHYISEDKAALRIQITNFNQTFSQVDNRQTYKPNLVEVYPREDDIPTLIKLSSLYIPTWWLIENNTPFPQSHPEYDNALWIEIITSPLITPGKYTVRIESIEFIGKWFRDTSLYIFLMVLWLLTAFSFTINHLRHTRRDLNFAKARQNQLEALNQLLNVKSQKLKEQLIRDPLTGAFNRDGIAHLFGETITPQRPAQMSVIFMDIDHFKHINDTYGHGVGDEILVRFVQIIRSNTREGDVLARWGGEEFILACPNTSLTHATLLAEKLRISIEETEWLHDINITSCFGVAEMHVNEAPTSFIERADKALYKAKSSGRNCVIVADSH